MRKELAQRVNEYRQRQEICCNSPTGAQGKQEEQKITKGQQDPGGEKQQDLKSLRKSPETTRADSLLLIILVSKLKEYVGLLSAEK